MAKILIIGDSWACGEWGGKPYTNTHRGLEYFLSKEHEVTNLGKGATSNNYAITKLSEIINNVWFDYIFWFQTEPLRDLDKTILDNEYPSLMTYENLINERKKLTMLNYLRANRLGVKIHVLGGAVNIDPTFIKYFDNLIPYIVSITEWLCPDYKHSIFWNHLWFDKVADRLDINALELLIEDKKKQQKLKNPEYSDYFPDGGHAGRLGHQKIYEKIKKDFDL